MLDNDTMSKMAAPRCGDSDHTKPSFAFNAGWNSKWPRLNLSYRILSYTPDLSKTTVEQIISTAFETWSNHSALTFSQVTKGHADIMFRYGALEKMLLFS